MSASPFDALCDGQMEDEEAAAFLLALKARGEDAGEILAAACALRARMVKVEAPDGAIDVCGTGGDGSGSYNISTAVAFVVAACGVCVAKHGNRAVSSRAGSSDVLAALGIPLATTPDEASRHFEAWGISFLSAPAFHPALLRLAPLRQKLGTRTILNLLGPLCNPARPTRQLVGIYDPARQHMVAEALHHLGSEAAWVVHGTDERGEGGLDELSIGGESQAAILQDGKVEMAVVTPSMAALPVHPLSALKGGDAAANAAALLKVIEGEHSAYRDAVLLNAAAALVVAERADDLATGALLAAEAIDSGRAQAVLKGMQS